MDRQQRFDTASEAIHSIELDGFTFTDWELDIISQYVDGLLTLDDVSAAFKEDLPMRNNSPAAVRKERTTREDNNPRHSL